MGLKKGSVEGRRHEDNLKIQNKQLEIMQKQSDIQEKQARFNKIIAITSVILAISALFEIIILLRDNTNQFIRLLMILSISVFVIYLIQLSIKTFSD